MKKDNEHRSHVAGDKPIARLVPSYDYLHFVCQKCDAACDVDYLGLDPSVPKLGITCPNCGELWKWKIHGAQGGWFEVFRDLIFEDEFAKLLVVAGRYVEKNGIKLPRITLNGGEHVLVKTERGWAIKSED